jgi:glycosyltransferase involved in cell wall biosynthesis
MFLSIIIPVYNVENYLRQCLDSVLSIKIENSEVILVTGNSADCSNDICLEYAKKNSCIKLLKQKSTGLSDARNCGMQIATGDYITFLDSDDYIRPKRFSLLLNEILRNHQTGTEVYVSDFDRVAENGRTVKALCQISETEGPIFEYNYLPEFLRQKQCFWNVWRYVYRRDFLLKNDIVFKNGFLSEDIDYTVKVLLKTHNIAFFHNPYYCYRVGRVDSLMGIISFKRVHDTVTIIEDSIRLIRENKEFPYKDQITEDLLFEFILNMAAIREVPAESQEELKKLFQSRLYLLEYGKKRSVRMAQKAISMFGINIVSSGLLYLKKEKKRFKRLNIT